ncbi:hypothetical protein GCM10022197_41870 [Microlunatus spumicola]|uniref:Uncharacterized protein n=1 Tax=Microlunatus spumicola TaxID=81499 RepID=A0ABP6YEN1_9ACTN
MNTTADRTTIVPPCPDWCQRDFPMHREDFDGHEDGLPARWHAIEYDPIEAKTDQPDRHGDQPGTEVLVTRTDKKFGDRTVIGEVRIAMITQGFPHYTIEEFDHLITRLQEARVRAVDIPAP